MSRLGTITLAVLLLVSPALAGFGVEVGDDLTVGPLNVNTAIGGFNATSSPVGKFQFFTFCAELNEQIVPTNYYSGTYHVYNIDTVNDADGHSLTGKTAWLYTGFVNQSLPGVNYASQLDIDAVQYGIWKSMGYDDNQIQAAVGNNTLYSGAVTQYGALGLDAAFASSGWGTNDLGNVRVVQLTFNNSWSGAGYNFEPGDNAQDILTLVPAPGAALLGVLGCSALVALRRRFS